MLRFTGHPIADVGIATIAAFCQKPDPSSLTKNDLRKMANFLEKEYFSGKLPSYLTCVFPNSAYVQPAMKTANIERFKREILYAFEEPPDPKAVGLRCTFSAEPASRIVYRQHVPMITGEDVLNFFPAGTGGLPISGAYLLAIQAFPMGARRCYGRALSVHCPDDPKLTYAFAHRFLSDNRKLLLLTNNAEEKYPDAKAPKTLIIHVLLEIEHERRGWSENEPAPSVTVYHLTNSGQGPDINLFQLPSEVVKFIRTVSRAGTSQIWHKIQSSARQRLSEDDKQKNGKGRKKKEGITGKHKDKIWSPEFNRNYLYDDLFDLPANAARFVRTYFLRQAYRFAPENDPRRDYRLTEQLDLVSWNITRLFLKEVMGMEMNRIEAIRTLGDRVAEHIAAENDRRLFQGLYRAHRYVILRNLFIKASNARLKKGRPPLLGLDEFLLVFEEGEELARTDWTLARDLVLIRVIEDLHRQGWFGKQLDALEELEAEDEAANLTVSQVSK